MIVIMVFSTVLCMTSAWLGILITCDYDVISNEISTVLYLYGYFTNGFNPLVIARKIINKDTVKLFCNTINYIY